MGKIKKSQIRCIVGNSIIFVAGLMTLCFYLLNLIKGLGRNQIYDAITRITSLTGTNVGFYIAATAFYIITLILTCTLIVLSILGIMGGIFDIKGLNMTMANRTLSIINMISALMGLVFMIIYVSLLGPSKITIGAGPIIVFLVSILPVVGSFVAQTRKSYKV